MPDFVENKRDCPPPHVWDDIATGLIMGDAADEVLHHAAQCPSCAAALRQSLEVFASDVPVRTSLWQFRWAAAAILIFAAGSFAWWQMRKPSPESARLQLAEAYSAHRLLEVRWPGARHARYALTRGAGVPTLDFHEADEAIRNGSANQPSHPGWQLASAQLAILSGDPSGAIPQLERLRSTPSVRLPAAETLAIALYQQAELTGQREGYEASSKLWTEVLAADPANLPALYNAALAAERLENLELAIQLLQKVIASETDPGWRQEAIERSVQLRSQLQQRPSLR
ncbi:MAG: hypothetical protein JNL98_21690 [Bryobacterales bacterium]|nr:hypothetical protein [Bryobacterales bacterium]